MPHRICRVLVPALLAALAAVPALAAEPVPDSRYEGQTSQGARYRLEFRVAPDATRVERLLAQFKVTTCEQSERGTQGSLRIAAIGIDDGRFAVRGKETARLRRAGEFEGGEQIERYRLTGHFPDGEQARGRLKVTVEIRDRAGETVDTCTSAKRISWSADRLGVGPEQPE